MNFLFSVLNETFSVLWNNLAAIILLSKIETALAYSEKCTLNWLKPSKLAPSLLKQDCFKRYTSLVVPFTGQDHLFAKCLQFNIFYLFIEYIYHQWFDLSHAGMIDKHENNGFTIPTCRNGKSV